jgi:hypothetical protein
MTAARDLHIAWLERQLAQAEHRMDALLYGEALDLAGGRATVLDLAYEAAHGSWQDAGYGQPVDLAGDDGWADDGWDGWEAAETRALGTPEDRLRGTWNGLDQTPPGRAATSAAEMHASVSDAQRGEIARLQREVAIATTPEADLIDEYYARTGVRR